ncbi:MAG: phosphomethylpyrimidine synthase ThiC, partial [Spirochaetales bacterium]|nr:phosphomethylpyrimidine synthase ThiC [Spirochaetales bacterium]
STKVNANIGTSGLEGNIQGELEKLMTAVEAGADAVMDLSTGGDLDAIRTRILAAAAVPVGTVPVYSLMASNEMSTGAVLAEIEKQAAQGVDFFTIHAGVTRRSLSYFTPGSRTAGVVSRGGSFLSRYIRETGKENPFYEAFDEILAVCREYRVTVSLGDGLRPGACADAGDGAQIAEILELRDLTERCRTAGVQVIIEGPGHVPLDQIDLHIRLMKHLCRNAPVYVLGPLTIDTACGHDHITGAIGGAIAAFNGADFLCYVTPAEHLCLPGREDVRTGVIASLIAARSGDLANGTGSIRAGNDAISRERRNLNWEGVFAHALDPQLARSRREASLEEGGETGECTMCGRFCALKNG